MLQYEGQIWRPPSEANSLILQATIGCSNNPPCTFCVSYRKKIFRVRSLKEISNDINQAIKLGYRNITRIFLADGDGLVIKTKYLSAILDTLNNNFPYLERVGIYASTRNILNKSLDELKLLKEKGLGIIYVGFETGDDKLLKDINKAVTSEENIKAGLLVKNSRISLSAIIILGLGGLKRSKEHISQTASMINSINPDFLSALTLMTPKGTEIYKDVLSGQFQLLNPLQILKELRYLIHKMPDLENTLFRTNHASNYLPLRGILARDRTKLVGIIDQAINDPTQYLRPESLRGL